MVRINDEEFKIYTLDNLESFKNRLASTLDTIPKYLFFPDNIHNKDIFSDKNIIVEDLLDVIKKNAQNNNDIDNNDIINLIQSIKSKVGNTLFNKGEDIVSIWLFYNGKLWEEKKKSDDIIFNNIGQKLKDMGVYISSKQIYITHKNTKNFNTKLKKDITENKKRVEDTVVIFNEYDNINKEDLDDIIHTDFVHDKITYKTKYNLKDITLLELFNSIKLDKYIPFVATNNYYKILNNFKPQIFPNKWNISEDDILYIYMYNKKKDSDIFNQENYILIKIVIDNQTKYVNSYIDIKIENKFIEHDMVSKRLLSIFTDINIQIDRKSETKISGKYHFLLYEINKYIFSELVMNDPIFNRLIDIDNSNKSTKKKQKRGN